MAGQSVAGQSVAGQSVAGWIANRPDGLTDIPNNEQTNRQTNHLPSIIPID